MEAKCGAAVMAGGSMPQNKNYSPAVVRLHQPVYVIYVVKTLKEFNKSVLSVFCGEMEVITILTCMIPVDNFQ